MSRKSKVKNNNLYITVGVVLLLLLALSLVKKQQAPKKTQPLQVQQLSPTMKQMQTYYSEFLQSTFEYPSELQLEEKFGRIYLRKDKNLITIHKVGTNKQYTSLSEFIDDVLALSKNQKKVKRMSLNIDSYPAESVEVTYPGNSGDNNKAYYIFINGSFYHLYTRSSELYPDLDRIARSFRYEQ